MGGLSFLSAFGLMTVSFVGWLFWRGRRDASSKVVRTSVMLAGWTLAAVSISLAVTGVSGATIVAAVVTSTIVVIEGLSSMIGSNPAPDAEDDAPKARALPRDP